VERRQKYRGDTCAHGTDRCLSPSPGASCLFVVLTLGLTPQAKNMPRLRRSSSGVNLFQDATGGWDLYLASCILHLGERVGFSLDSSHETRSFVEGRLA